MYCSQCGTQVAPQDRHCRACGAALSISEYPSPPPRQNAPEIALWNPTAASTWSVILTPVFGSFLQMRNWQRLGQDERASASRAWLIFSLLFYALVPFGVALLAQQDSNVNPQIGAPAALIYILAWYFSSAKQQQDYFKSHVAENYQRRSLVFPVLLGLVLKLTYWTLSPIAAAAILAGEDNAASNEAAQQRSDTRDPFSAAREEAEKLVASQNADLPKQIDSETRWERVELDASKLSRGVLRFTYDYTLINYAGHEVDLAAFRMHIPKLVSNGCAALRPQIDAGAMYIFRYSGNDGVPVEHVTVDSQACGYAP